MANMLTYIAQDFPLKNNQKQMAIALKLGNFYDMLVKPQYASKTLFDFANSGQICIATFAFDDF